MRNVPVNIVAGGLDLRQLEGAMHLAALAAGRNLVPLGDSPSARVVGTLHKDPTLGFGDRSAAETLLRRLQPGSVDALYRAARRVSVSGALLDLMRPNPEAPTDAEQASAIIKTLIGSVATNPQAVPLLVKFVEDIIHTGRFVTEEQLELGKAAIEALATIKDPAALKALIQFAKIPVTRLYRNKNLYLVLEAIEALGKIGGDAVVDTLLDRLNFYQNIADPYAAEEPISKVYQALGLQVGLIAPENMPIELIKRIIMPTDYQKIDRSRLHNICTAADRLIKLFDSKEAPLLLLLKSDDDELKAVALTSLLELGGRSRATVVATQNFIRNPDNAGAIALLNPTD